MSKTTKKPKIKRPGRGSLMLIAILLIGSALVRVGTEAGQAIARETATESETHQEPVKTAQAECKTSEDMATLLTALQTREKKVIQDETHIKDRLQALAVANGEIDKKLAELRKAEEDLKATIALADSAAEDDLIRLTAVYENMKPKDAAALFEEMDPEFAAGFLGRMRPDAAAGVLAGLSPQAAYGISVILAGRNASVPKE